MPTPIIVASHHGAPGFESAIAELRDGANALDVVITACQAMQKVWLRQFEMDALVMEGKDLHSGAVLALPRCPDPVRVALHIMEGLPFNVLAAQGAARAAMELGMEPLQHDYQHPTHYDPEGLITNYLVQDAEGRLAVGVVGHSMTACIVGSGGYAHDRYGAAAASGSGDLALRTGAARSVVLYMKMGLPLWNACRETIKDSYDADRRTREPLHLIALDVEGNHAGFSNEPNSTYLFQRLDMDKPERQPRTVVGEEGEVDDVRPALSE